MLTEYEGFKVNVRINHYIEPTNKAIIFFGEEEYNKPFDEINTENIVTIASTNLGHKIGSDEVMIKNWSENAGIEATLKELGLIKGEPLYTIPSGFVEIPVYRLTDKAMGLVDK